MMKKVLSVLMIVIVVVSLVGCGDKISAEVKNTMSEYESICDEYCATAKKASNGDTLEAAGDLMQLASKLSEVKEKVESLSKKNLSDEEKKYVTEVAERCISKVQEAMKSFQN